VGSGQPLVQERLEHARRAAALQHPFLRPIEDLLRDPEITEVMVNDGGQHVFVERAVGLACVHDRRLDTRTLMAAIKNIARSCGDELSEPQPMLDARLEDGSRVAAMRRALSPPAIDTVDARRCAAPLATTPTPASASVSVVPSAHQRHASTARTIAHVIR
jgi:Flp pilus assembly CpaF family ATPase